MIAEPQKRMLALLHTALLPVLAAYATETAPDAARPNVVLIVTDDAGYTDFGFTGSLVTNRETPPIPTPNIDRIAAEGVRFDRGYVTASVCSPSRAGMLTGRYQQRFGHECNLGGNDQGTEPGTPAEERTIAEMLRSVGYATGAFGKWHIGGAPGMRPIDQGFDVFRGLHGGSRSYFAQSIKNKPQGLMDGASWIDEPDGLYVTDWIGVQAAEFIRASQQTDQPRAPFFAYVAFTAPHTPMHAIPADLEAAGQLLPAGTPETRITYTAMTIALDRAVGAVLDAVDATPGETIVFVINDNGGATNNGSDNGPYRGMKGSKWEGGIRVPFALRWAGVVEHGRHFGHAVSSLDIAATISVAAGVREDTRRPLDGVDLVPYLTGRAGGPPHRSLYWRRDVAAAVQRGDWKLIRSEGNPSLLFDLASDPGERFDLSDAHPDITESLLADLRSWEAEMIEPRWLEGARWQRNQSIKHRMSNIGREAERRVP